MLTELLGDEYTDFMYSLEDHEKDTYYEWQEILRKRDLVALVYKDDYGYKSIRRRYNKEANSDD